MKPIVKLALVVGLQVLLLLSLIGFKQYTVWTGETVLLKVQPVDPRDLLRGDYITVRYDISTIDLDDVAGDDYVGGTAYVELREDRDGYWDAVAVHDDRARSFDDTVLIKAHVIEWNLNHRTGSERIELDYGIEEVFIPEGSGNQLSFGDGHVVAVEVKVDRWGNAVPRRFYVDGEPFDLKRR
ncbi:MAG TPA: GDYXXLXY domain-containing protein [Dehalococcoidia bacterium]|jgi:uncharacterized membrane-anchored protein|nr:GDYXXLXY domain-containing protein [Dehalococcoidia bacterium]